MQTARVLENEFQRSYAIGEGDEFAVFNDSHYWLAEYRRQGGVRAIACKFGVRIAPTNSLGSSLTFELIYAIKIPKVCSY